MRARLFVRYALLPEIRRWKMMMMVCKTISEDQILIFCRNSVALLLQLSTYSRLHFFSHQRYQSPLVSFFCWQTQGTTIESSKIPKSNFGKSRSAVNFRPISTKSGRLPNTDSNEAILPFGFSSRPSSKLGCIFYRAAQCCFTMFL